MKEDPMKDVLKCSGELVTVNGHKIHVYRSGSQDAPAILLMSGHCTIAPVYDFKVLYEKLLPDLRVIVVEKFGYGYSDLYQSPCDARFRTKAGIGCPRRNRTVYPGPPFHVRTGGDQMETNIS